jgi:hypothetical protein
LHKAAEYSAAQFMELLEATMDEHIQQLRVEHPDCKFEVGQDEAGEEWKE